MNLIKKKLIQNYFEVHGSFDKIVASDIGALIQVEGQTTEEVCYKSLGYVDHGKFTAKQCHDMRVALKSENLTLLRDLLGTTTVEEAKEVMVHEGILNENVPTKKATFRINNSLKRYSSVLASYFRISKQVVTFHTMLPLCYAIDSLKAEPKNLGKNVKAIYENNQDLIAFDSSAENPYVYKNTLYADRELTEKEKRTIILDALKLASGLQLGIDAKVYRSPYDFAILSFEETEKYLDILEDAEANHMTYAQYLSLIGINVPNYAKIYCCVGMIPIIAGNTVYLLTEESTEETPLIETSLDDFNLKLRAIVACSGGGR